MALKTSLISLLSLFILFPGIAFAQEATIREENTAIKTYPYSDPNPVPSMGITDKVGVFYPYFIFDGYTDKGIDKSWKVVSLENEFIEVTVLPEQGGKVWGAIEKSTGEEFIYLNHVQKFRSIGIRGPWTSGGIEHNFGLDLGHAPWTAAQVDYVMKENADGSVSCVVGGLDLASRTQWRVEIRLPEDKAYFETNSMWYNPTPLHDAYMSWENAAYKGTDDLEFFFSGNHHIGHGGDIHPWPVDEEGRKISLYKENNFGTSKSYHVFGLTPNWFGGYYHNTDFGTGHWASYDDAPGKKIWIWSLARLGAIWEGLLTDEDGQYIEAQSGVKFNQAGHTSGFHTPFNQLFMRPHYTDTKNEYWFPVKETGGIVEASPAGSLNLVSSNDSLSLSFCPNISIRDSLVVKKGESKVFTEFLQLKPMQVYKKSIPLSHTREDILEVHIGTNLLNYTSDIDEIKTTRPIVTPANQDYNSAEHLFRYAEDVNSMRLYDKALDAYFSCLEKEPTHSRALGKVAELHYRKGQYNKALSYAAKVLENNTYDAYANFIYGVSLRALGDLNNAREGFSVAVRSMEYRSAGYVQIAGICLQEQDYEKAEEYAEKSLDYNRYNIKAYEFLSTALRKLKREDEAKQVLESLLETDPLNHYARFEQYLLNPDTETLSAFNSAIQNELPHETYLELAIEYANQGLYAEATQVLEQSPEYPVAYYWLAYLTRDSSPGKSKEYLDKALSMSPEFVFPFRLETIPVFEWAQEQNSSWKSNYYLALIYWKALDQEKAKAEFDTCGDTPDDALFYISRGLFKQKNNLDRESAEKDFLQAFKLEPDNWRTAFYLSAYYSAARKYKEQLEFSTHMYAMFPENPNVGIAHSKSLINNNKNMECLKVLAEVNVLPAEFANAGHGIYERANLMVALDLLKKGKYKKAMKYVESSKEYPENLGSGAPYDPDNRLQDYISAFCESELGNQKAADNYKQNIIDFSLAHRTAGKNPFGNYLAIEFLNEQGKSDKAKDYITTWENEQKYLRDWKIGAGTSSSEVQWVLAKYNKEQAQAENIETEALANNPTSKFSILLEAIKEIGF